ncbi:hypothetical protein KCP77_03140 [Salmonella enterica subsp. enterica]|nr:hypothetical protein KCP77_03140 [Salmonella enterica subsp. enterica]
MPGLAHTAAEGRMTTLCVPFGSKPQTVGRCVYPAFVGRLVFGGGYPKWRRITVTGKKW